MDTQIKACLSVLGASVGILTLQGLKGIRVPQVAASVFRDMLLVFADRIPYLRTNFRIGA